MNGAGVEDQRDIVSDPVPALMARDLSDGRLDRRPIRFLFRAQMQGASDPSHIDISGRVVARERGRTEQRERERSRAESSFHCEESRLCTEPREEMPAQFADSAGKLRMK